MFRNVLTLLVVVFGMTVPAFATQVTVTVQSFSFTPANATILPTDTMRWTHANLAGTHNVHHNATPSLFGNAPSGAAWTYSVRFDTIAADTVPPIGTYPYVCEVHPTLMMGNVFVRSLWVSAPASGVSWPLGSSQNISWSSGSLTGNVNIELNRDYPNGGWEVLFANTANDGSELWTVAGATTANARIRVTSVNFAAVADVSCCDVAITPPPPTITVTLPNGGEIWDAGTLQGIEWNSSNVTGTVTVELNRDEGGGRPWEVLFAGILNDGGEGWTVTGPGTATCRIRVTSDDNPSVFDVSDADFTISAPLVPSITVMNPNGGQLWYVGEAQTITWASTNVTGDLIVELNRDFANGGTWEDLFGPTIDDGSEVWFVSAPVSSSARIRVRSIDIPTATDISDTDFVITQLAAPQQLTIFPAGTDLILRWQPVTGADGYTLYKSDVSSDSVFSTLVGQTAGTTLTDIGGTVGQLRQFYQVRAYRGGIEFRGNSTPH